MGGYFNIKLTGAFDMKNITGVFLLKLVQSYRREE